MRLIWSKLAAWRLFFLGKDLVLHFKQFQFDGPTFFNYIQHSKMQHFVVFSNSPDGSEKVDLMLFLWSACLVRIYSLTSFLNTWKSKLCSFFELPAWWKCTHWPLLTKLEAFESSKLKKLEEQTLFILWAHRLVEIYSLTSFVCKVCFFKLLKF